MSQQTNKDSEKGVNKTINFFKPSRPIQEALPDFLRDLIILTVVTIIFFWFGASFHILMNGYRLYKQSDFKGTDVTKPPYTCHNIPKEGTSVFSLDHSSSVYCANGFETLWGWFPEIIEWYQHTLKDTFSSSRTGLMKLLKTFRSNYKERNVEEGYKGFLFLLFSSLISFVTVFTAPVSSALILLFYCFRNIGHFFFVNNPDITLKREDGTDDKGAAEFSWWIGNGNDEIFTLAFGAKCMKWYNIVLWAIGLGVLMGTVPLYILFSMLYWILVMPSSGAKIFNRTGDLTGIWDIIYKQGKNITTLWLLIAGGIAYKHIGFGGFLSALAVALLHMGINFYGYVFKEEVNIN